MNFQLSCETISSAIAIYNRITENISEKYSAAVKIYKEHHNRYKDKSPSEKSIARTAAVHINKDTTPTKKKKFIPVGDITINGSHLHLSIFGYSLRDPSCCYFTLESYQFTLAQNIKRDAEIHRQLSIKLGKNRISESSSIDSFLKATETKIFVIPVSTLIMYSVQQGNPAALYLASQSIHNSLYLAFQSTHNSHLQLKAMK
jgi:hypothetical protein